IASPSGDAPTVDGNPFNTDFDVTFAGGTATVTVFLYNAVSTTINVTTRAPTTPTISSSVGGDELTKTVDPDVESTAASGSVISAVPTTVDVGTPTTSTITVQV